MSDDVLIGRYELGRRIGAGGMSTVRLAFDRRLERNVAVKLLAEHLADDPTFVQRFQREAKAAARLVHPNIVQVFDYGFDPDKGRYYIVMEYVQGRSGAELLKSQGRLSPEAVLHLADGACRALEHAHRHGVIHRDVKPGNLMLGDDGQVKLADFGIAWAGDAMSVTQHGAVLGTVSYLAPEQASGEPSTPQADIYGLGVVVFQLLTGRLPFAGQSLSELVLAQRDQRPPRLDRLVQGIPPYVAETVDSALAYDARRRPASAEAMRQGLLGGDVTGVTRIGAADPTGVTQIGGADDPTGVTRVSRRAALGLGGAGAAAGAEERTGIQRIQPRPAAESPDPWNEPPGYEPPGYDAPRATPPGARPGAPARSGGGLAATALKALVIGGAMAALGGLFGTWLSDTVSGFEVPSAGGDDLPALVEQMRGTLEQ